MGDKVLIVDDERTIATLTAMWMRLAGYEAVVAYNATTALALAAEHQPQLILLDIRMPDLDGFEVHRQLRANPELAAIPVIFLSAHAQEEARQEAAAGGAAHFLSKPYEFKELIAAARAAVKRDTHPSTRPLSQGAAHT